MLIFWARYSFSTILFFIVLSFALLLFMDDRGLFKGLVSWKIQGTSLVVVSLPVFLLRIYGDWRVLDPPQSVELGTPNELDVHLFQTFLTLNFSAILGNNLTKIQNNVTRSNL